MQVSEDVRSGEDGIEHRLGQPTRECVLLAHVEAPQDGGAGRQLDLDTVAKCRALARHRNTGGPQRREGGVPSERAEHHNDAHRWQDET